MNKAQTKTLKTANSAQRRAITTTDGPVLIIAGPGTGKTFTLVQRVIYLIETGKAKAENIFIATFTEKAAKELVTRITDALADRNITANLNEMYVGTFHSLCLRILKEHIEYTRLKKNYRTWETFEQQYMVLQNYDRVFGGIPNSETILPDASPWKKAETICKYVNNLSEELVNPEKLKESDDAKIAVLGHVMEAYQTLLEEQNALDFSAIQVEAYKLLCNYPDVLKKLQDKITHFMVDEYQDTNYIQEQLVFTLAGRRRNICVVGDDDQGLYRFRGATIRNILEFPKKFEKCKKKCCIIKLNTNYRSNKGIVDFYNTWMQTTQGKSFEFSWKKGKRNFRFDKQIIVPENKTLETPTVVTLSSENNNNYWNYKIKQFLKKLYDSGRIKDYNQVAFLFSGVKGYFVTELAKYLESEQDNDPDKSVIKVYSPRSGMFFQRKEIRLAIGFLILLFPNYRDGMYQYDKVGSYKLLNDDNKFPRTTLCYYRNCVNLASEVLDQPQNAKLMQWINEKKNVHKQLRKNTDYAYTKLLYQLFAFEPFAKILDVDMQTAGVVDTRATRNLAKLTELIGRFEQLYNVSVLSAANINETTEKFFNEYLRLIYKDGIDEYEDDSEYAPSGCVSFLTIHQSKGMEFPIVFVDSLMHTPDFKFEQSETDIILEKTMGRLEQDYFRRKPYEPQESKKFFDFWRKYYTAFSRAQNLLILTCNKNNDPNWLTPSVYFEEIYNALPEVESDVFDINEFEFEPVKDVNIKKSFAFTSDIAVYDTCALQYKFYKELGFAAVHTNAMLFGTLVHETIEDVHKAVLRKETETITKEKIEDWFAANYDSLSMQEHSYLDEEHREAALQQVLRYVQRQKKDWTKIQQTEVDVSLVEKDYIIEGKIDLIRGENGTVEIVDFKSEKRPDKRLKANQEKIEKYHNQLNVYAALVEERTGQKVSRMCLYYTGQDKGESVISFPYEKKEVEATKKRFDETVHKILEKDYSRCATEKKVCDNCDFKWYCKKSKL